jgi:TPR repeat protein
MQGNVEAQSRLGFMYRDGSGGASNKAKALEWFGKAAMQGHARAAINVALMYGEGEGVAVDLQKALYWYRKVIERKDEINTEDYHLALSCLAGMYGKMKQYNKAFPIVKELAQKGDANAQDLLGGHYMFGWGTDKDDEQALFWWRKAAAQGHSAAQQRIDKMRQEEGGGYLPQPTEDSTDGSSWSIIVGILITFIIIVLCISCVASIGASKPVSSQVYVNEIMENARQQSEQIASQRTLVEAIKRYKASGEALNDEDYAILKGVLDDYLTGYDFLSVCDAEGIVLARTDNGELDYSQWLPRNGYSLMANPDIQQVFANGESHTALAFILNNSVLAVCAFAPVYDGDELIGIITCQYNLPESYFDLYKE